MTSTTAPTQADPPNEAPSFDVTVVIPSFARSELVARLLSQLALQTLAADRFEVIVVDDGSPKPVEAALGALDVRYTLTIIRQANAGPGAARHHGATRARGRVLVFLDDDMEVPPSLLEAHLAVHAATPRAVVIGHIRPAHALAKLPIFERYHASQLDAHIADLRATGRAPRGSEVCTGNLSMTRDEYVAVGGFDPTLGRSEDAELGVRLEKAGAKLRFSAEAYSTHDSDHTDEKVWLRRAFLYGVYEHRIARKHPDVSRANPWHWLDVVSPLRRPLLLAAVGAPKLAEKFVLATMRAVSAIDAMGLEKLALAGTTVAYGMQYFRGVRSEEGSLADAVASYRDFERQHGAKGSTTGGWL